MLQTIRGRAGNWIVRILFGVLVVSFAVWGIGDIFRNGRVEQNVATVGDTKIPTAELDRAFQADMAQYRQVFGPDFDRETAAQIGLLDQALNRLVDGALFDQAAGTLDLVVSDDLVAERIRTQPAFQDPLTRQFSRQAFLATLNSNGLTEEGYVGLMRRDILRQTLGDAIGAGASAPQLLADTLFRYQGETRTAEVMSVLARDMRDVAAPTEDEIQAFFDERQDEFRTPEYRVISILPLTVDRLAAEISIGDDELRAAYDDDIEQYSTAERRRFDQVVVPDQEQAQRIVDAARGGQALQDAAAAVNPGVSVIALDWTTEADMPLAELGEAGFALEDDQISDPVQSPLGWHVLQATGVEPGGARPFEEVRGDLEAGLRHERALDAVFELANSMEDARAAGSTLEEVAGQLGLDIVVAPPVTATGEAASDATLPDLAFLDDAVRVAFTLEEGAESTLQETPEGDAYVVRVDEILPPAVPPLADVRPAVEEAALRQRRADAAKAAADEAAARVRAGETVEAVAAATGRDATTTPAMLRDGSNRGEVPSELVTQLFGMKPGDVAVVAVGDDLLVARLAEVTPPDPAEGADRVAELRENAHGLIAQDLVAQYVQTLRARTDVDINRDAVDMLAQPL